MLSSRCATRFSKLISGDLRIADAKRLIEAAG